MYKFILTFTFLAGAAAAGEISCPSSGASTVTWMLQWPWAAISCLCFGELWQRGHCFSKGSLVIGASNTLSKDGMRRHHAVQERQLKISFSRILECSGRASAKQYEIKGGRPGCHGLRGGLVWNSMKNNWESSTWGALCTFVHGAYCVWVRSVNSQHSEVKQENFSFPRHRALNLRSKSSCHARWCWRRKETCVVVKQLWSWRHKPVERWGAVVWWSQPARCCSPGASDRGHLPRAARPRAALGRRGHLVTGGTWPQTDVPSWC